jgi:hypothetical protein
MQTDKDLFEVIKESFPLHPRPDFVSSTEMKLRQSAKKLGRKRVYKRYSLAASGVLAITLAASWLFFFNGKDAVKYTLTSKFESAKEGGQIKQQGQSAEEFTYSPPRQEENFSDMTKEQILTKMINSVDYFQTAKGEFKIPGGNTSGYAVVDYEISLRNLKGGFSKVINEKGKSENEQYYKDGTIWMIFKNQGSYREDKYQEAPRRGTLTIKDAFTTDKNGDSVTDYRERPPIGAPMSSLFHYEIVSSLMRDLNKWEIEKQNEMLLGHNTMVIKGKSNRRDAHSFRFWVDKDTGILLKYETYSPTGQVVDYLYPTKLEINVPINSKDFVPNLEGLKKQDPSAMEKGPYIVTGNIDSEIPGELKQRWEQAKKDPNHTSIFHWKDDWYFFLQKGYLLDNIEVKDQEGVILLAKTSPQKSQHNFTALAKGYKLSSIKIVYENN